MWNFNVHIAIIYIDKKLSLNFICVHVSYIESPFNLFITILQQIMEEKSPL